MTEGKWVVSEQADLWDPLEEFDSKETATTYAMNDFADHHRLEPGNSVYIGQVSKVTIKELAESSINAEIILDTIEDYILDRTDYCEDYDEIDTGVLPDVTQQETEDLNERLVREVVNWFVKNKINPKAYRITNITSRLLTSPMERYAERKR